LHGSEPAVAIDGLERLSLEGEGEVPRQGEHHSHRGVLIGDRESGDQVLGAIEVGIAHVCHGVGCLCGGGEAGDGELDAVRVEVGPLGGCGGHRVDDVAEHQARNVVVGFVCDDCRGVVGGRIGRCDWGGWLGWRLGVLGEVGDPDPFHLGPLLGGDGLDPALRPKQEQPPTTPKALLDRRALQFPPDGEGHLVPDPATVSAGTGDAPAVDHWSIARGEIGRSVMRSLRLLRMIGPAG
jgi:hypothetical protein